MKEVITFQKQLSKNNTREWFHAHKEEYVFSDGVFKNFVGRVEEELNKIDTLDLSRTKVYRIYRDVRFSKDKTPYTKHRSVSFVRASSERRGGYYLKIQPGNESYLAGGFWQPNPADLLHIRKQISQEPDQLKAILSTREIQEYFGNLEGEKIKTSPKGFDKGDPAIDLLRHKGFVLTHKFKDEQVLSENFVLEVIEGFARLRPFFDYMSEILTTDLNGEPIV
jgi:uncharacterized protein (TIGR02453 family)